MSNPLIYTMYHDKYQDTGDFGGDIQRAISEVHTLLDEHGIKVSSKTGAVFAEVEPQISPRNSEEVIYEEREVPCYDSTGKKIGSKVRSVPVKRIPRTALLPNEKSASSTAFDRARAYARLNFDKTKGPKGEGTCPFTGTLAMVWHSVRGEARRRKTPLDLNILDAALRTVRQVIAQSSQTDMQIYQDLMSRIGKGQHLAESLETLHRDFHILAQEMHDLQDFSRAREEQLDVICQKLGVVPDQLVSCDLEGNIIGGTGLWQTDRGRWIKTVDQVEEGELFADHYTPGALADKLEEEASIARFQDPMIGSTEPRYEMIFDPRQLISKPLGQQFDLWVNAYTIYFWPIGQEPTKDNTIREDFVGFWSECQTRVINKYPNDKWQYSVSKADHKVQIKTFEPVTRRPSWHLECDCGHIQYAFTNSDQVSEFTELARLALTKSEWLDPDTREYKAATEKILGMSLLDFMHFHASREDCGKCGQQSMRFITPMDSIKSKDGSIVEYPKMVICSDHAWWQKPVLYDNWDSLLRIYGNKREAAKHFNTIMTEAGPMYAEQVGDTTYKLELDWLSQERQFALRQWKESLDLTNLTSPGVYDFERKYIKNTFNKAQQRFANSYLFMKRHEANLALIKESKFVEALEKKLVVCTLTNFHETYALLAGILVKNTELAFCEKAYAWALINNLREEFQIEAQRYINSVNDSTVSKWEAGLRNISFRHFETINAKANLASGSSQVIFLIRELVRSKYRELAGVARTTQFIQDSETYLLNLQQGLANHDQNRIDDILAASKMAKSAAHLAEMVNGQA